MTMIRTLAFAGLTVIASMGAASAATVSQVPANLYQSHYHYQGQEAAFLGNNGMSDTASNSPSCYRGVLPFRIQTCGVE